MFLLVGTIVVAFRFFIGDFYKIPSGSMNPTIISGDYVLVNKIIYGPRILNLFKLVRERKLDFMWLRVNNHVKRNDIIVFNYPQYDDLGDSVNSIFGTPLIKRCFGVPGDSVRIRRNDSNLFDGEILQDNLFAYDTLLHWNLNNYGPLYVPRKGDTLKLTIENIKLYKDVLLYEMGSFIIREDSLFLNDIYVGKHCFRYNYYFMLGDNFYKSKDSRFWGFLPETHIIGRVDLVLLSLDPNKRFYKKLRWNRIIKKIN